jgi:1,4-dihydroxy-2-naphthoate polyprenyltransferase
MTHATPVRARLGAYARLAKLDVWDYYLAIPLAWALCGPSGWTSPATTATAAFAPHSPLWAVLTLALCFFAAVQYSWGLKISYRGWQEAFLAGFGVGLVLAAVGLCTGHLSAFTVVQSLLFGLGPLLFGVYSNTRDITGDARVGRPTAAVLLSATGNRLFIAALSISEIALIVFAAGLGAAPWWFPLAMLPSIVLRITQLRRGIGLGDLLGARLVGLHAHRTTVALLIAVNLLTPTLGAP